MIMVKNNDLRAADQMPDDGLEGIFTAVKVAWERMKREDPAFRSYLRRSTPKNLKRYYKETGRNKDLFDPTDLP